MSQPLRIFVVRHGETVAPKARRRTTSPPADRVVTRLRGLVGTVALFSHGQFGRVLAARWLGLPALDGQGFALAPASVGTLGFEDDDSSRPVISLWNATASALGGIRPTNPVADRRSHDGGS